MTNRRFCEYISECIEELSDYPNDFLVVGDFNINWLDNNDTYKRQIENTLLMNSCKQIVTEPTRITTSSKTLIDFVITNNSGFKAQTDYDLNITDHETIVITKQIRAHQSSRIESTVEVLKYRKEEFLKEIKVDHLIHDSLLNVDGLAESLQGEIDRAVRKLLVRKEKIYLGNEWFGAELLRIKKEKLKKRIRAILTNDEEDWSNYRILRNVYKRKLEQARSIHTQNKLNACTDQKSMWRVLKTMVSKEKEYDPRDIYFDNIVIKEGKQLADKFNEYFIESVEIINCTMQPVQYTNFIEEVESRFVFQSVGMADLEIILSKMNNKKDYQFVNKRMIIDALPKIGPVILRIINESLLTGKFPEIWKKSMVTPIKKMKNATKCEDFRPINALLICEKILEKVVHYQLENYLENNNIIIENQSGFRKNHSCESAINMVLNIWKEELACRKKVLCVFLDLKKAFETVDRSVLLKKLEKYGVKDLELRWFEDYLTNRTQTTKVSAHRSRPRLVNLGVPQGSVLGTLLFIVYINDLNRVVQDCTLALFADDAVLFIATDDAEVGEIYIQHDLDRLDNWMKVNKLKLNVSKTKCMCMNHEINLNLVVDGCRIEQVQQIKYLGVIIDERLKFEHHVTFICKKVGKKIGFMRRIRKRLTRQTAINMYNVTIKPHFEYCSTVLYLISQEKQKQLQKMQNRAMRLVLQCDRYTSIDFMLNELRWLSIKQKIAMNVLIFVFKIKCNQLPNYLNRYIRYVRDCQPYNIRNGDRFRLPNFREARAQNSLIYKGFKFFNDLPQEIRCIEDFHLFRRSIMEFVKENIRLSN